jgi:hypothetical protein
MCLINDLFETNLKEWVYLANAYGKRILILERVP